ncbi:hypothetical protein Glove_26g271 [Diversispora epigaea]|uniref:Uncharacterized protein n=1 Tax=Diversispora epigaea TaxID=1348612 RepID=A0A397JT68_9GLOM|nr:hypothetical protein Glove_26g271 [Diversispora epigaea]
MPSRTSYDKPFPFLHYQYFSYIPEDIVNHFQASFLQDVDSKLGFHRTTEGIKKFQWKFPEGESGYKRIGTIFRCEVWGKKQNKLGSESFVLVEERDSNSIYHKKEIIFTWREKIVTKVENEKSFYVPCGILECILEVRRETVEIINI